MRALGARVLAALLGAAEADAADDVREAALAALLAPGTVQHPVVCARLDALGAHPVSARAPTRPPLRANLQWRCPAKLPKTRAAALRVV